MTKEKNNKNKRVRLVVNIFLTIVIVITALSNIFSHKLEILFRLKPNLSKSSETQVHFIDVGQGDAIAINFSNGKTMLIDSGLESHLSKLVNYLDHIVLKGSKTIDYVILTHPDADHSSNMDYIIRNYEVGIFYRPKVYESTELKTPYISNIHYRNVIEALNETNTPVEFSDDEIALVDGDIKVDFIISQDYSEVTSTNDLSPIIIIEDNNTKIMLTGDACEDVEKVLLENTSYDLLDVDILKLGHHGSRYSTTYELLEATSPKYVVACVGENSYGHPSNYVMERLLQYDETYGSSLYENFLNTRDDGNIIYTLNSPTTINIELLSNIDDYIFVDYWVYSLIIIVVLIFIVATPYAKELYKKIRFIIRNKKHVKLKEKEKSANILEKNK